MKKRIKQTVNAILKTKPDLVLTIDSPGFARAVVSGVKKSAAGQKLIADGLKFHHVVAPQVWAWRPGRAKKYAAIFDKLYAFFDIRILYHPYLLNLLIYNVGILKCLRTLLD